jgi:glycosyltransferase involved in cell wall biosynthesis
MTRELKTISYVLPVFNESAGITEFYKHLAKAVSSNDNYNYEFVFVNDGSRDDSLDKLRALNDKDKRVKIVNFSRNFGHQIALTAGIDHAIGDALIIMDTDLQDPPEVSMRLITAWEKGFEVVYAKRRSRIDGFFKKVAIYIYYRIQTRLANIDIPLDTGDFRLIDKKVADSLRALHEKHPYIRGLVSWLGFSQTAVEYDRQGRFAGETNYPFKKLVKLALDGLTGFSTVPLQLITRLGFTTSLLSVAGIIYVLITRIFFADLTLPGWAVTMIAILFMGGIQLITLGVIGTYIGRIYSEVQNRPRYIVANVIGSDSGKKA